MFESFSCEGEGSSKLLQLVIVEQQLSISWPYLGTAVFSQYQYITIMFD